MSERQRFIDSLDVKFYFWFMVVVWLVLSVALCERVPSDTDLNPAPQDR